MFSAALLTLQAIPAPAEHRVSIEQVVSAFERVCVLPATFSEEKVEAARFAGQSTTRGAGETAVSKTDAYYVGSMLVGVTDEGRYGSCFVNAALVDDATLPRLEAAVTERMNAAGVYHARDRRNYSISLLLEGGRRVARLSIANKRH